MSQDNYSGIPRLNSEIKNLIGPVESSSITIKEDSLYSKSDRILELSNDLKDTIRDQVGAFLFIKNRVSNDIIYVTNDFWLNAMQIAYKERVQITESFNSSNFAFFGDNAKIYNFSAVTVDSTSSDLFDPGKLFYQSSILKLYKDHLRGTKLVENNNIAVLCVANHMIEGYPINLNVGYSGDASPMTQFSFAWLVTNHYYEMDSVINNKRLEKMYSVVKKYSSDDNVIREKIKKLETLYSLNSLNILDYLYSLNTVKEKVNAYNTWIRQANPVLIEFQDLNKSELDWNDIWTSNIADPLKPLEYREGSKSSKNVEKLIYENTKKGIKLIDDLLLSFKRELEKAEIKRTKRLYT